ILILNDYNGNDLLKRWATSCPPYAYFCLQMEIDGPVQSSAGGTWIFCLNFDVFAMTLFALLFRAEGMRV
ncbi:hypothetical protein, partial [Bergeriella denitrificans]|uniref:hypothetical protein n=1 Tax=Bergeriella denitrificans TaxID=494 RepID=UPI001C3F5BC1